MNELKKYIQKLKDENDKISKELCSGELNQYSHTAKVHIYNHTLGIIKDLEKLSIS